MSRLMIRRPPPAVAAGAVAAGGGLEIRVDDLDAGCGHAWACRAALAAVQPQEFVPITG